MNTSQLKALVLVTWGIIIIICGVLAWALTRPDSGAGLQPGEPQPVEPVVTTPSAPAPLPAATKPGIIYLPSATARFATEIPTTPTPTFWATLAMAQYSITLSPDFCPLTGQRPTDPAILNRRPIAVKISSFPRGMVRPVQSGLSRADVAYEYYIEDGLTRFIAVFYSRDAERAGPVRSGRYFDEYVMRMYHSSLVYGHADKRVQTHLHESDLKSLLFEEQQYYFPPFWDSGSKNAENRLFVDTSGVGPKLSNNSRQELRAALFAPIIYPGALPAIYRIYTHYSIYSYNYWEFDPARQVYLRFSDANDAASFTQGEIYTPHIDHLTSEQIAADNVVVLIVPHLFHNEFDREDQVFDISLNGSGEAFVFREGRMIKANWVRDQVDQPILLVDANGSPVPLKAGVTFYQVINPESSIEQAENRIEFFFSIPPRHLTPTPSPWGYKTPTKTPRKP